MHPVGPDQAGAMTRLSLGSATRRALLVLAAAVATGTPSSPAAAAEPPGVWPLDPVPEVVRGFDPPEVRWEPGHRGVDLAGRVGQPVRAALPGTVSFAGHVAGRAIVVVDHGSMLTTYQPVAASVHRGEDVARGEVIGTLAWFGTHCLPAACLHWGLLAGDDYLDPLALVGGPRPVRLLPLEGLPDAARPVPGPAAAGMESRAPTDPTAALTPALRPGPALVAVAGAVLGSGPV